MQRLEQAQHADAEPGGPVLGMEERGFHWAAMITGMLERETYAPEGIENQMATTGDVRPGCVAADSRRVRRGLRDHHGQARLHHVPGRLRRESLRLFYADAQGARYESFERLQAALAREQKKLVFAMNAGMFHPDMKPVGLLVIDGREIAPINRSTGSGNFYLQPNGVFLIDAAGSARARDG